MQLSQFVFASKQHMFSCTAYSMLPSRSSTENSVACVCGAHLDLSTLLQERKAAVIRAEGESESARLISDATRVAGPGLIELRRIEAAKDVASTLARSGNVVYLPNQNNMLLGVNPGMAGGR